MKAMSSRIQTKYTVPFWITVHYSRHDGQQSLFRQHFLVEGLSDLAVIMKTFWVYI